MLGYNEEKGRRSMLRRNWLLVFILVIGFSSGSAAQEKIKFPVSASSKILGYAPLWIAAKRGFFDQQGLEAQVVLMRGGDKAVQALVGGSVYAAVSTPDVTVAAVEQGLDLAVIGGMSNKSTHIVIGGKGYKTYEDLRGATIGSSGLASGVAFLLKRVLKAKGLEYPADYKLINVGGSPLALAALSSGQIGAALLSIPTSYAAEEMGFNAIGKAVDVVPNYVLSAVSARRSWAERNRPLLVRFMKAMVMAMRWVHENKEAAVSLLATEVNLKPEHARKGWEYYVQNRVWDPDARVNVEGIRTVVQIYEEQIQAKGRMPSPEKFVDQSYLMEALRELGGAHR
ncbi:MAG: ABC transporter substrate-binding protein [Deltaproteobacteria bacterium]|nr:ABC transporter substrate-binding protein [Deltaproteobacteria bacterium]